MRQLAVCLALCLASLFAAAQSPSKHWRLTWSDEFSAPNQSSFDANKWTAEIGGNGWGNHELEFYTSRPVNVFQRDGNLVIVARREEYTNGDNTWHYTSARLKTLGRFSQR